MPHVVMEYSNRIHKKCNVEQLLKDIHTVVRASDLFDPAAIKSRSIAYDQFQVGDNASVSDFVHVSLWILKGRPIGVRQSLGKRVLDVMKSALSDVESLTVDIREMEKATYMKHAG